ARGKPDSDIPSLGRRTRSDHATLHQWYVSTIIGHSTRVRNRGLQPRADQARRLLLQSRANHTYDRDAEPAAREVKQERFNAVIEQAPGDLAHALGGVFRDDVGHRFARWKRMQQDTCLYVEIVGPPQMRTIGIVQGGVSALVAFRRDYLVRQFHLRQLPNGC